LSASAGLLEDLRDDWDVGGRPRPEERERDVELLAPGRTKALPFRKRLALPLEDLLHDVVRKPESAKEPQSVTLFFSFEGGG
jgi:hypothetical protein